MKSAAMTSASSASMSKRALASVRFSVVMAALTSLTRRLEVGAVGVDQLVGDHGDDVVGGQQAVGVLEHHQPTVGDDAAGREEHGHVDLIGVQGVGDDPRVQGREATAQVDAVDRLQAGQAEGVGLAVLRGAQREVVGQVADARQAELVGGVLGHHEGVGVDGRRRLEGLQADLGQLLPEQADGLVHVGGRLTGELVQELEHRRHVLRGEVDVAGLEGRDLQVTEAAQLLVLDGVARR